MTLTKLSKKIERIENKDPEFRNNKKWQSLRKLQDNCYVKLAIIQIEQIANQLNFEKNENRINTLKEKQQQLKKFIKDQGKDYERFN